MTIKKTALVASVAAFLMPIAAFAQAARPVVVDGLSSREKLLLVALCISGAALLAALISLYRAHGRFKRHLAEHRMELKKAFADAYVGMKDGSADATRVRDAEQAIDRIISDLENFM